MNLKPISPLALALFLLPAALSSPARSAIEHYGLDECLRIGLERSEEVRMQDRLVDNAERDQISAWTNLLPSMEYSLSRGFTQGNPIQLSIGSFGGTASTQVNNYLTSALTITETLYDNHLTLSNTARTAHAADRARFSARASRHKLMLDIIKAYYQLATNYQLDLISQEALQVARKQFELAQAAFEAGNKPRSDMLKAKVALQSKEAKLYKVRAEFASAKATLFNRLALETDVISIDLNQPASPLPFVFAAIPAAADATPGCRTLNAELETARTRRPDLLAQTEDVRIAEVDLNDSWRKFLPRLDLRGSYAWTNPKAGEDLFNSYSSQAQATLNLSWTIWDWGANWRSISSKRVLRDNLEDRRLILRRQVALELQTTCLELQAKRGEFVLNLQRVNLSRENMEKAEGTYRAGKDPIESVFQAREEYIQALQDRVSSYYAFRTAEAQRDQANGTIDQRLNIYARRSTASESTEPPQ